MYSFFVVVASFAVLVTLLRFKWKAGRSMAVAGLVLIVALPARLTDMGAYIANDWRTHGFFQRYPIQTLDLMLLVVLVNFLGKAMRELGLDVRMTAALTALFRSRRLTLAGVPAVMGLMPSPGGILLSAPIVREVAERYGLSSTRAAIINYWFRHQWEYCLPIFPVLTVISGILARPITGLILRTAPLTAAALLLGAFFLLRRFPAGGVDPEALKAPIGKSLRAVGAAVWPIGGALVLCGGFAWPAGVALLVMSTLLLIVYRPGWAMIWRSLRGSFESDLLIIVLVAMSYRVILQGSHADQNISHFIMGLGLPTPVLVFLLPFIVGIVTGLPVATMAITLPLLMPFVMTGQTLHYPLAILAFAGALNGVAVTPAHICFALSRGHFDTTFTKMYAMVLPIVASVIVVVSLYVLVIK